MQEGSLDAGKLNKQLEKETEVPAFKCVVEQSRHF